MVPIMQNAETILGNYTSDRHFLQNVHIPNAELPVRSFVYMKNHKSACTTVLATLLKQLTAYAEAPIQLDMDSIHNPPKSLILAGGKGLTIQRALDALDNRDLFRFTVIRHPIARTVSAFADLFLNRPAKAKADFLHHIDRPASSEITLSEFLEALSQDQTALDFNRHWRPQRKEISYDFVTYDYVGRVENLNASLSVITAAIFGSEVELQDTRSSLGHASNSGKHLESLTKSDVSKIETLFAGDFEMYEDVVRKFD